MHSVNPPRPSPKSKGRRSIPLYSLPKQPLQSNGQDFVLFFLYIFGVVHNLSMEEINGLLTIVWVSSPIRPKLPSRVRHLGQKVLSCKKFKLHRPLDFGLGVKG